MSTDVSHTGLQAEAHEIQHQSVSGRCHSPKDLGDESPALEVEQREEDEGIHGRTMFPRTDPLPRARHPVLAPAHS